MRILIIGGTQFLGRHTVEIGLERGHTFTLFHRGRTNPDLFGEVERIIGDRRIPEDLAPLRERTWDAVIDPSAYFPQDVSLLLDVLSPKTKHYTLVSSVSVYPPSSGEGPSEESPVTELTDGMSRTEITAENYGPLKAAAEEIARARLGEHALVVRPGLIVGPHDPSDRFSYWGWRVAKGGIVVAPGEPGASVQFIDVRDLVGWMLDLVESGTSGTFNATGPTEAISMGSFLDHAVSTLATSDTSLSWVDEESLKAAGVGPYVEMPLWLPAELNGMNRTSIARAIESGLTTRPLVETLRDTQAWFTTTERAGSGELRAGGGETKLREFESLD